MKAKILEQGEKNYFVGTSPYKFRSSTPPGGTVLGLLLKAISIISEIMNLVSLLQPPLSMFDLKMNVISMFCTFFKSSIYGAISEFVKILDFQIH